MKRDVTAEYQPVVDKLSKSIGGEAQDWSPKNDSLLRPDFDDRSVDERLADIEAQIIGTREALQVETRADKRIVLVDRVDELEEEKRIVVGIGNMEEMSNID